MDSNSDEEFWSLDWDPTLLGWGFPNWEIEETYHVKNWDMNRWRWEFLRRRSDYQTAFDAAFAALRGPVELPVTSPEVV